MNCYPEPLIRLISELTKLPGIGEKTGERLAFHILKTQSEEAMKLAVAIRDVKKRIRSCRTCFNVSEEEYCSICKNEKRNRSLICVVEQPKDLVAFEKTGGYNGIYHVLMGRLALLEGVAPEDLTFKELFERARKEETKEVILATNPDLEGDTTALYIAKNLKDCRVKLTRIARGIPSGSNIEHVSNAILFDALKGRKEFRMEPVGKDVELEEESLGQEGDTRHEA